MEAIAETRVEELNFDCFQRPRSLVSAPMRRPSLWLLMVIILLGAFILREPRLQGIDDTLQGWFMEHTESALPPVPVTLVEIGRGRRSVESMREVLGSRDRSQAGPTAPPQGLVLMGVEYHPRLLAGDR